MNRITMFLIKVMLVCIFVSSYMVVFLGVWISGEKLSIGGYIGGFCILAFLTYSFLIGVHYILHNGKKVPASLFSISSMDAVTFDATFQRDIEDVEEKRVCIARYEMDGKQHFELIGINRVYGIRPGKKVTLYVITHKDGVKVEYEVNTKRDVAINLIIGIPFAIALIGWVFLFIMRGL